MKYTFSLKYYLDNFIDSLDVIQQIISNLAFINRFDVVYLGQKIECSYKIPEEFQTEFMFEFDGITTDSKYRTISLELEVDTNMPVVYRDTVIPSDNYIKQIVHGTNPVQEENGTYPKDKTPYFVDDPETPYYPDNPYIDPSSEKTLTFRRGIILHEKGTIDTTPGENSSDEITNKDTYKS